jgi:hypothetical protein
LVYLDILLGRSHAELERAAGSFILAPKDYNLITKSSTMKISCLPLLLLLQSVSSSTEEESNNNLRGTRELDWLGPLDHRYKSTKISEEEKQRQHLYPPDENIVDAKGNDAAATSTDKGTLAIVDTVKEEKEVEDVIAEVADQGKGEPSRRKFVSYTPSKWEEGWSGAIADLTRDKAICRTLLTGKHQKAQLHKFMGMMCSARAPAPYNQWCYYHDHNHFMWYNSAKKDIFEVYVDTTPLLLEDIDPPTPMSINMLDHEADWESTASKFTFKDEITGEEYYEYIEPLVAQLRFPLTECLDNKPLLADFSSFVIPPPSLSRVDGRTIMFDMGSKDWSRLEYIVEEWGAHNAGFTYLITYANNANEQTDPFLKTVPEKHKAHIYRHYFELVDHPTQEPAKFYLPTKIQTMARPDDYVMVKLDRMDAKLKQSLVESIIKNPKIHVDELFWEINAGGNYVMQKWFDNNLTFGELSSLSLSDAYMMLAELRNMGIRAHAWV